MNIKCSFSLLSLLLVLVSVNLFAQKELEFITDNAEELARSFDTDIIFDKKYKDFIRNNQSSISRINQRLSIWDHHDRNASAWNFDAAGFYTKEANKEKLEIIGDEIFRYFKKKTKQPLKDQFRNWKKGLRRNYSIDSDIELTEDDKGESYDLLNYSAVIKSKEKIVNSQESSQKLKQLKIEKDKKKKRLIRFRLKSKITRGVLIGKVQTPIVDFSTLLGVNKQIDLSLSKWFSKPALYFRLGTDILEQRTYLQVDKYLFKNKLKVRFSTEKDRKKKIDFSDNSLLSLNYLIKF